MPLVTPGVGDPYFLNDDGSIWSPNSELPSWSIEQIRPDLRDAARAASIKQQDEIYAQYPGARRLTVAELTAAQQSRNPLLRGMGFVKPDDSVDYGWLLPIGNFKARTGDSGFDSFMQNLTGGIVAASVAVGAGVVAGPVGATVAGSLVLSKINEKEAALPEVIYDDTGTFLQSLTNLLNSRETPIATTNDSGLGLFTSNKVNPNPGIQLGEKQANARTVKSDNTIFYVIGALILLFIFFFKRS